MALAYKLVALFAAASIVAGQACTCQDVGTAPSCSGQASGVVFTITCTIPDQNGNSIFFAAQGLTATSANPAWVSPNSVFSRFRQPDANGFQSVGCVNPATPKFFAPNGQGWAYSYDENTCKVTATLQFGPNNLPNQFRFDNESIATSVSTITNYNLITVPIGIGISTQISTSQVTVSNYIHTFYARLPTALTTDATRYALKLFKLSDNSRETDTAFSAIVMGGLTTGPDRHVLENPVFIPAPNGYSLTCVVQSEIYVSCGPFVDTNAPTPVLLTGTLQVDARCLTPGCIPRTLYLPVSFLAGDYETTITGNWTQLAPLIWRRPDNNDQMDPELTNDVIVGGDLLIMSLHFDDGSLSTLTKLFLTVNGFSGAGATLVEYSNGNLNNVFVVVDTSPGSPVSYPTTVIYNQAEQSNIDSYFRFPQNLGINFAVQWAWHEDLPVDYRGEFRVDSFFDITYLTRRRQDSNNGQVLLLQGPQGSAGDATDGTTVTILEDSSAFVSLVYVVAALLSLLAM